MNFQSLFNIFDSYSSGLLILLIGALFWSCQNDVIELDSRTDSKSPMVFSVALSNSQVEAAQEGRLALMPVKAQDKGKQIPVQLHKKIAEHNPLLVAVFPEEASGKQEYKLVVKDASFSPLMKVDTTKNNSQPLMVEGNQSILQYNYHTVHEEEVARPAGKTIEMEFSEMSSGQYYDEYLKSHPTFPKDTVVSSAVYSIPRSDYIHPLYDLEGAMLTRDWPDGGHPHHRGIFWAWPEVIYKGEWGDIYALQRVFARPTGDITYREGPVYAQINAKNQWMWEDRKPIVQEQVTIRTYSSVAESRIIDLQLEFLALEEDVTIATRFTDSYGGLNIRMQTPKDQKISYFTDETSSDTLRAWADFNGLFHGSEDKSGLMILQHPSNPEYPGEWIEYPNLSWIQPTFPTPNTRYSLSTTEPLKLKYRFIVHSRGKPSDDESKAYWDGYNSGSPSID